MRIRVIVGNSKRDFASLRKAKKIGMLKERTRLKDGHYAVVEDGETVVVFDYSREEEEEDY